LGYGKPDVVKENTKFDENRYSEFYKVFSASFREIGYNCCIGNSFSIGAEAGFTFEPEARKYPIKTANSYHLIKLEFVPQLSYINDSLKLFAGVGVGLANGYGFKGVPNAFQKDMNEAYTPYGYNSISIYSPYGGYWIAEVGVDYLLTDIVFIGAKYQYERTFTTAQKERDGIKHSLYVQQHTFLATIGIKY
jgi:opacity protein-like surface antigen